MLLVFVRAAIPFLCNQQESLREYAMIENTQNENWTELYRRALFEEDREKLPALLEQAQQAVQARVLQLWYSPVDSQSLSEKERRELDAAAYYLGILKSLEARKSSGDWRL